jgi:predicted dehydrogenase
MSNSLLLIGSGQLGSRYLQGLVSSKFSLNITVVDPSAHSLETAISRWVEAGGNESPHQICWLESLPSDLQQVDLALIVTSSNGRADLIQRLADSIKVRHWVLEKVLAQSSKELDLIQSAVAKSKGTWVNTPRRMMGWHKAFKKICFNRSPLNVSYSGGLWGLACNSIHFIDLVAWWSGEFLVSVDTRGLSRSWNVSKRSGYFEITGELIAYFSGGSVLRLRSNENSALQPIRVRLADSVEWMLDESTGKGNGSDGQQLNGQLEFQSQLSGRLVDDILSYATCELSILMESSAMHAIFLDAMLAHWNASQNRNDDFVPIT